MHNFFVNCVVKTEQIFSQSHLTKLSTSFGCWIFGPDQNFLVSLSFARGLFSKSRERYLWHLRKFGSFIMPLIKTDKMSSITLFGSTVFLQSAMYYSCSFYSLELIIWCTSFVEYGIRFRIPSTAIKGSHSLPGPGGWSGLLSLSNCIGLDVSCSHFLECFLASVDPLDIISESAELASNANSSLWCWGRWALFIAVSHKEELSSFVPETVRNEACTIIVGLFSYLYSISPLKGPKAAYIVLYNSHSNPLR